MPGFFALSPLPELTFSCLAWYWVPDWNGRAAHTDLDTAPTEHTPLHVLQEECWTSQCTHQRAVMETAPPVLWSKLPRVFSSTPLTSAKKLPSVRRSLLPLKSSTMFFLKSSAFFTPPSLYAVFGSAPGLTSLRHKLLHLAFFYTVALWNQAFSSLSLLVCPTLD